jgi:hypothetical protein
VQIDHPDAQAAIDMLKDAKVTPIEANAIFEEAMKTGDQSKINWALLEAKIGPAKTRLVKNGVDAYYNDHVKTVMATKTAVFEIVGSEDNWNKITAWAKGLEKTDATFAAKLGPMRQFEADPKNKGLGVAKVLVGGKSVPVTGNPITNRTDYMAQLKEAQAKGDQVLVASLRERRRAGMRG